MTSVAAHVQSLQHGHERSGDDRTGLSLGEGQHQRAAAPRDIPRLLRPDRETAEGERRVSFARWGLPSLKDAPTDKRNIGNTNIRHPWYADWKGYLGVEHRCLVPFNRFAEPITGPDGKNAGNAWFAFGEEAPLSFFAGLRTHWFGTRRV